jgi:hypothetical protein
MQHPSAPILQHRKIRVNRENNLFLGVFCLEVWRG